MWLLPPALAAHNLEEALFFPRYLPRVLSRLPAGLRDGVGSLTQREIQLMLLLATVILLALSIWATFDPPAGPHCG